VTGKLERELEGHAHPVIGVAFSAKGDLLYSVDDAGSVRTWDLRNYRELQRFAIENRAIWCYAFSPDRTVVATGAVNRDQAPRFWNLKDGSERVEVAGPQNTVLHLAFLAENKLAVGAYGDGTLTLWDPQTGKQVDTITAPGPGFEVGAIAPQGAL